MSCSAIILERVSGNDPEHGQEENKQVEKDIKF